MRKHSRSILCKIFFEDINNFCLFNPFRFSRGLIFLFSKYYNLYRLNFHKQSKIFYKRLLFTRNKFQHKRYFKKIKLIKQKYLFFFGFRTFKQLNYYFNAAYSKKTFFFFNHLFYWLEFRIDFILYRLRVAFSLFDVRTFVQNYGFSLNNNILYKFNIYVNIGDIITLVSYHKINLYLKFYYFWFNEFIYSNKLIHFSLIHKIIILKKIRKKISFFRKILKKNFIFFSNNIILNVIQNKYLGYIRLHVLLKRKLYMFKLSAFKFFDKNRNILYYIYIYFIYFFYNFIIFQQIIKLNIVLVSLLTVNNQNEQNIIFLKKKNIYITFEMYNMHFLFLLISYITFVKLKFFQIKGTYFQKNRFQNYSAILNRKILSKTSVLIFGKRQYIRFLRLLKDLVIKKVTHIIHVRELYQTESHFKLKRIYKLFKKKFKFFSFRLKSFISRWYRRIRFRILILKNRIPKIYKYINFFKSFYLLFKAQKRIYKPLYIKKMKMRFFSLYRRVTYGFKYIYINNRKLFQKKFNRLKRLFLTFSKKKNFFNFSLNMFQYNLQQLGFQLKKDESNSNVKFLWLKHYFNFNFLKFFYLARNTDFSICLYRLNRRLNFNYKWKFLFKYLLVKHAFFKIKQRYQPFREKVVYKVKQIYFSKNMRYLLTYLQLFKNRFNALLKKKKIKRLKLRGFFRRRLRYVLGKINLQPHVLKDQLFGKIRKYRFRVAKFLQIQLKKKKKKNFLLASVKNKMNEDEGVTNKNKSELFKSNKLESSKSNSNSWTKLLKYVAIKDGKYVGVDSLEDINENEVDSHKLINDTNEFEFNNDKIKNNFKKVDVNKFSSRKNISQKKHLELDPKVALKLKKNLLNIFQGVFDKDKEGGNDRKKK